VKPNQQYTEISVLLRDKPIFRTFASSATLLCSNLVKEIA
jgi:hypothetical protein